MKEAFKKFFSSEKGNKEMKKEDKQAPTPAVDEQMAAQLKQAQEILASKTAEMETLQSALAEMAEKVAKAEAALQENEAAKAVLIADAKAKQAAARKEKVVMAIGENDKATKLLAATEGMEDAAFEAVVSALAGSLEQEAKSEMFKDVGADGAKADASKTIEKSAVMKALEDKYQAK
jgi:uncharacterized membrane protein YdfJ with MMPL/SSD domain